jgi:hypothetical protein
MSPHARSRRLVLNGTAPATAALALPCLAFGQEKPERLGFVSPLTGPYALFERRGSAPNPARRSSAAAWADGPNAHRALIDSERRTKSFGPPRLLRDDVLRRPARQAR